MTKALGPGTVAWRRRPEPGAVRHQQNYMRDGGIVRPNSHATQTRSRFVYHLSFEPVPRFHTPDATINYTTRASNRASPFAHARAVMISRTHLVCVLSCGGCVRRSRR